MNLRTIPLLALFLVSLTGCGESDLHDIHDQQFDDAIADRELPVAAPAQPVDQEQTPAAVDLSQYEMVFSEEFNSDELDYSKWGTRLLDSDTVIYDQLQYYVDTENNAESLPDPFSFNGQHLTISATRTPDELRASVNEQAYLSGLLTTRERFQFTYGYIETRINVAQGRGLWPALWMLAAQPGGLNPEVYLFEHDGARTDSVFHNYNYVDSGGNLRSPGQQDVQTPGFAEGFHTIGLRWTPNELLFYVDDQPSYRIIGENVPREDMFLVMNLAMGGVWPGAPDGTTPDPATLEIDYVRVYQLLDQ